MRFGEALGGERSEAGRFEGWTAGRDAVSSRSLSARPA